MVIIVDAMGGDNAPEAVVNGCIDAVLQAVGMDVILVGDAVRIRKMLDERGYKGERIKVHNASEAITNDDSPTKAIKNKKDSSMVVGLNLLKEKQGDVFLSAGNSGALMTGALFILGRIKGVDRPALAPIMPTKSGGGLLLIDGGANTNCKPINYLQFGVMGSIYMKSRYNLKNPAVGLINVGSEEKKGNEVTKQAYSLLSNASINFIGNIEGRQLLKGEVNVAVCDGFVGNVLLKFFEGAGEFFFNALRGVFSKNIFTMMSALAVKSGIKKFTKMVDYEEVGGVPILGVDGMVIKCHGSSNAKAVKNAVLAARNQEAGTILEQIREEFKNMEVEDIEQ